MHVDSHPSGNPSSPELSPDNVLRAMEGIEKWKELCSSSCGIKISREKLHEIETQQQFSIVECKKAAISFWLKHDPAPSWRRLIVGLDEIEAFEAAEKIRKYAEPLRGNVPNCITLYCYVAVSMRSSDVFLVGIGYTNDPFGSSYWQLILLCTKKQSHY